MGSKAEEKWVEAYIVKEYAQLMATLLAGDGGQGTYKDRVDNAHLLVIAIYKNYFQEYADKK